jgi:hypothetical protein
MRSQRSGGPHVVELISSSDEEERKPSKRARVGKTSARLVENTGYATPPSRFRSKLSSKDVGSLDVRDSRGNKYLLVFSKDYEGDKLCLLYLHS